MFVSKTTVIYLYFYSLILFILDSWRIYPNVQLIDTGRDARITCVSTSAVTFFFNRRELPENARLQSRMLQLNRISEFNKGYYDCEGIDHNQKFSQGNKRRFAGRSMLIVKGKC